MIAAVTCGAKEMRMVTMTLWSALLFPGCDGGTDSGSDPKDSGTDETDADTDTDSDADSDTDSDTDTDTDADLPDIREDIVANADACQNMGGSPDTQGAQTWYWGELTTSGAGWSGQEAWYFYMNDAWVDAGGSDCVVVWNITAAEGSVGSCSSCDLGLVVNGATVDTTATTCPSDAYDYYDVTEETYAVERPGDGSSKWYFLSGSFFSDGYGADDAVNYLASGGCEVRSF